MEMTYGSKVLRPADVSIKTLDGSVIEGKVNLGYEIGSRTCLLHQKGPSSFYSMPCILERPRKRCWSLTSNSSYGLNRRMKSRDQLRQK